MAIDLSALSSLTNVARGLGNILLVNPQINAGIKPNNSSDPKFLFNFEGENRVTLTSDITDHFVEDNTAIQDQIALRPEIVTTMGYIGELNDIAPDILEPAKEAADKLILLAPYTPELTTAALIAYNQAKQAYDTAALVAKAAVSAWDTINSRRSSPIAGDSNLTGDGKAVQTEQQRAFTRFFAYWQNRQLFQVQTPWAIFTDMAIQTLNATQDEDTKVISGFEITFKKIKFVRTLFQDQAGSFGNNRGAAGASSILDKGVLSPGQLPSVSYSNIFGVR